MGFKIEQGEKFALLAFSGLTIGIDDQSRAKLAARPRISIISRPNCKRRRTRSRFVCETFSPQKGNAREGAEACAR
jgi:hypothetical protein